MIYTFLLVLLILDCVLLIGVILIQAAKGGGLAASFGGAGSTADALFGSRQATNILTKGSWVCGGTFLFLAYVLSLMTATATVPSSVLDPDQFAPPAQTAPGTPSPLQPAQPLPLEPAQPSTPAPTP